MNCVSTSLCDLTALLLPWRALLFFTGGETCDRLSQGPAGGRGAVAGLTFGVRLGVRVRQALCVRTEIDALCEEHVVFVRAPR